METLKRLEGLVDIYLPDFKYADAALAAEYSHAPDYFERASEAIKEMNQNNQAVRITENKFILGNVYNCLSDAPDNSEVFSIEFLENVK